MLQYSGNSLHEWEYFTLLFQLFAYSFLQLPSPYLEKSLSYAEQPAESEPDP